MLRPLCQTSAGSFALGLIKAALQRAFGVRQLTVYSTKLVSRMDCCSAQAARPPQRHELFPTSLWNSAQPESSSAIQTCCFMSSWQHLCVFDSDRAFGHLPMTQLPKVCLNTASNQGVWAGEMLTAAEDEYSDDQDAGYTRQRVQDQQSFAAHEVDLSDADGAARGNLLYHQALSHKGSDQVCPSSNSWHVHLLWQLRKALLSCNAHYRDPVSAETMRRLSAAAPGLVRRCHAALGKREPVSFPAAVTTAVSRAAHLGGQGMREVASPAVMATAAPTSQGRCRGRTRKTLPQLHWYAMLEAATAGSSLALPHFRVCHGQAPLHIAGLGSARCTACHCECVQHMPQPSLPVTCLVSLCFQPDSC